MKHNTEWNSLIEYSALLAKKKKKFDFTIKICFFGLPDYSDIYVAPSVSKKSVSGWIPVNVFTGIQPNGWLPNVPPACLLSPHLVGMLYTCLNKLKLYDEWPMRARWWLVEMLIACHTAVYCATTMTVISQKGVATLSLHHLFHYVAALF